MASTYEYTSSAAYVDTYNPMHFPNGYKIGESSAVYGSAGPSYNSYTRTGQTSSWGPQGRISSNGMHLENYVPSSSSGEYSVSNLKSEAKGHQQRRPSNRDEFDGPHQYIPRPPLEYIAQLERQLPQLPTNLVAHEQDDILTRVNDRLSQCAYDFVAKYQFPIPLADGMRPVERPQDREWTEWVYLLKRLATKRRIPAHVLYNGQIKQFITILEGSLEMRHAAKHQSRPLKDDRNILQLISAGTQVAKLVRDADAMTYMDQLYLTMENTIKERKAHYYSR